MPDQSSAADEHAILQGITAPLATLPDDPVAIVVDVDFPVVRRGYDRFAVDAYVKRTSQLVAELQATRSPEAAVRRAIERMGEQTSGILQRAHDTAEQITAQSRTVQEPQTRITPPLRRTPPGQNTEHPPGSSQRRTGVPWFRCHLVAFRRLNSDTRARTSSTERFWNVFLVPT